MMNLAEILRSSTRYWLVKSEPESYGWAHLTEEGEATWDGVRNYQARNFMREMSVGDLVLFYHSGKAREIVGIAEITQAAYPDPTTDDERWIAVSLQAVRLLDRPVSLDTIKSDPELADMYLVRQSRLSVMPVEKAAFDRVIQHSKEASE